MLDKQFQTFNKKMDEIGTKFPDSTDKIFKLGQRNSEFATKD